MLNKPSFASFLLTASALSALTACNAPVPGLQQAAVQQKQPAQAVVPALPSAQLADKQTGPAHPRSEGAVVSEPAGSFAVKADFGPDFGSEAAASNVADFTQNTADFTGADVNAFWARATHGGIKERFVQQTAFGTHLINPDYVDLKTTQGQGPLFVKDELAIGVLGSDNFHVPYPLSSSAREELEFVKTKGLTEAKFVWAADGNTLRTIYLRLDNGELREVNGPFSMMGTGWVSVYPEDQRPLLQKLLESTTLFNRVDQQASAISQSNSGNTITIGGGSQNTGNTSIIGGGSQNTGTTQFLGGGNGFASTNPAPQAPSSGTTQTFGSSSININPWGDPVINPNPWGEPVVNTNPWGDPVINTNPWGEGTVSQGSTITLGGGVATGR